MFVSNCRSAAQALSSGRAADVVFDAQMAAVQAVLSAAGLVSPNTKLRMKSTVTEHATCRWQADPTATECYTSGIRMFSSKLLAQHGLNKIVQLLVWMAYDYQSDFSLEEVHSAAHAVLIKYVNECRSS